MILANLLIFIIVPPIRVLLGVMFGLMVHCVRAKMIKRTTKMARRKNILIPSVDSFKDSFPSRRSVRQLVALLSFFILIICSLLISTSRCNTIHCNANSRCQSLDRIRIDNDDGSGSLEKRNRWRRNCPPWSELRSVAIASMRIALPLLLSWHSDDLLPNHHHHDDDELFKLR